MTQLALRWPALEAIPYRRLGHFPTPLHRMTELSGRVGAEVFCKRDDLTARPYGGNKARKLEFLVAAAKESGADSILTVGAVGSHHVLATAIYAGGMGFDVHAVVAPQRRSHHAEITARATVAAGAILHPVSSILLANVAMKALEAKLTRFDGRRVAVIGFGGSEIAGVMGYVEAGLEIAEQLLQGEALEPDAFVVPLGSGGTAVGLAVGLAAAGVMAPVIAMRVAPKAVTTRSFMASLARGVVDELRKRTLRFPNVADVAMRNLVIDNSQLGDGYALPTKASLAAKTLVYETQEMELDDTYTAKTMAGVIALAGGKYKAKRLMYIHTLGDTPWDTFALAPAPLKPSLAALLR